METQTGRARYSAGEIMELSAVELLLSEYDQSCNVFNSNHGKIRQLLPSELSEIWNEGYSQGWDAVGMDENWRDFDHSSEIVNPYALATPQHLAFEHGVGWGVANAYQDI